MTCRGFGCAKRLLLHGFSTAFSTWPIFFCTFPAIFSPNPSASKSGLFVSWPTFSFIFPFTSWTWPAISFSVLCLISFLPRNDLNYCKQLGHASALRPHHKPESAEFENLAFRNHELKRSQLPIALLLVLSRRI